MKAYVKKYLKYFNVGGQVPIDCEICYDFANDIHHIHNKKMGGQKTFNYMGKTYDINDITNLIALCRDCHIIAHKGIYKKESLMSVHAKTIKNR